MHRRATNGRSRPREHHAIGPAASCYTLSRFLTLVFADRYN